MQYVVNLGLEPKSLNSEVRFFSTKRKINVERWKYQSTERNEYIWEPILEEKPKEGKDSFVGHFYPLLGVQLSSLPNKKYSFCFQMEVLYHSVPVKGAKTQGILWNVYSLLFPSAPPHLPIFLTNFYIKKKKSHLSSHVFSKHMRRARISLTVFSFFFLLFHRVNEVMPFPGWLKFKNSKPTIIPVRILLLMALKEFGWHGKKDKLLKFLYCWHPLDDWYTVRPSSASRD